MSLADVASYLRCPHCAGGLAVADGAMRCAAGHAFDVARQGYVSLLPGDARTGTADTASMVAARDALLATGRFARVAAAVAEAAAAAASADGCVVDVGAGTGYYLARVLDRLPDRHGIAVDLSKYALRRAARAHPRAGAVAGDAWWGLPVRSGVAAVVLSAFAPRNPPEFSRVLGRGGGLVVASPSERHLREIVGPLGLLRVQEDKESVLDDRLAALFQLDHRSRVEYRLPADRGVVEGLALMGPSAHHVDAAELRRRLDRAGAVTGTTVSVVVSTYRRRP